jgi:hypothetical protein
MATVSKLPSGKARRRSNLEKLLKKVKLPVWMGRGTATFLYAVGIAAIGSYAVAARSLQIFGILWMIGNAAWIAGIVLGFLFGVPRVQASDNVDTSIIPNTNLEQISDWLTKIIVGATLVQLGPLAERVANLSTVVGRSLGSDTEQGAVMSGGVIVFYSAAGFIWGYLWCSLRVFREIRKLLGEEEKVAGVGDAVGIEKH